ncbi:unnamed protein product [Diplocarpon coronariae]
MNLGSSTRCFGPRHEMACLIYDKRLKSSRNPDQWQLRRSHTLGSTARGPGFGGAHTAVAMYSGWAPSKDDGLCNYTRMRIVRLQRILERSPARAAGKTSSVTQTVDAHRKLATSSSPTGRPRHASITRSRALQPKLLTTPGGHFEVHLGPDVEKKFRIPVAFLRTVGISPNEDADSPVLHGVCLLELLLPQESKRTRSDSGHSAGYERAMG